MRERGGEKGAEGPYLRSFMAQKGQQRKRQHKRTVDVELAMCCITSTHNGNTTEKTTQF